MARKTLLTEAEVRRFMKLAKMAPAGDQRIQEMGVPYGNRDEADPEALADYAAGDLERGAPKEALTDEEEAVGELDDVEGEVTLTDDEAETLAAALPALEKIASQVEPEEDVEAMDVEMDLEEPEGLPGADVEMETDVEDVGLQERSKVAPSRRTIAKLHEDSGADEAWNQWKNEHADDDHIKEMEHHLRALKEDRDYERHGAEYDHDKDEDEDYREGTKGQDAIVGEVARRVAARLTRENKKGEVADQLAERIMARLVK